MYKLHGTGALNGVCCQIGRQEGVRNAGAALGLLTSELCICRPEL